MTVLRGLVKLSRQIILVATVLFQSGSESMKTNEI